MRKFGKIISALFIFGLSIFAANHFIRAAVTNGTNVNNLQLDSNGIYDSSGNLRIDVGSVQGTVQINGNVSIPSGSHTTYGTAGVGTSTTTTSGSSQGSRFSAFLASGTNIAAVEGSLICSTTTQQNQLVTVIVCPATSGVTTWLGVSDGIYSTGTVMGVYSEGWVLALTTGTVNAGDVLVSTSLVQGYLAVNNSPTSGTDVATALAAGNSAGATLKVKLH